MTGPARDGGSAGARVIIFRRPRTPVDEAREIGMAFPGWHVWYTPESDTWNAHREGEKPFFGRLPGSSRRFMVSAYDAPGLIVLLEVQDRAEAAIATLTSQGRSVGVCVVGALQDPRKDVINLRNLFPTRIAMRLDESDQVDMVLGDGARDRGAIADQISPLPEVGAGVAYVRLEASPDPVRARAGHVTDTDIDDMAVLTKAGEAA